MKWFGSIYAAAALALAAPGCSTKAVRASTDAPPADAAAAKTALKMVKFDPAALDRLGVRVQSVGDAASGVALVVPGTLEYNLERYAEVGSLLEGRMASIRVKVGDPVKKGQVLGTVVVPAIATAQSEYLGARAASKAAEEQVIREEALLAKQLTTAREAEIARSESTRSHAQLAAAAAKLEALGLPLPEGGHAIGSAGTLTLRAPIDGVIVRREAVLGGYLQPNEIAFVVADPRELWATLEIYESDLAHFEIGADVELTVDALPGTVLRGKVTVVEPQIGSRSRALRARIAVPNPEGTLRAGLFVRAMIQLPPNLAKERLLVPAAAVQPIGDTDVVFVAHDPGAFEVRPVKVVRRTAQVAELGEGLSRGERIAVEGAFLLRGEVTKQ